MTSIRKLADQLAPQLNLSSAYIQQVMRAADEDWIERPGHRYNIVDEAAATYYILKYFGRKISQPKINWIRFGNLGVNFDKMKFVKRVDDTYYFYTDSEYQEVEAGDAPEVEEFWQWFEAHTSHIPSGE